MAGREVDQGGRKDKPKNCVETYFRRLKTISQMISRHECIITQNIRAILPLADVSWVGMRARAEWDNAVTEFHGNLQMSSLDHDTVPDT